MNNANQRLDVAAKVARRAEDALRRVAADARKGADEACDAGVFDLAAQLHQIAGGYEQAAAIARTSYGIARAIHCVLPDGGVIAPQGGGKD